MPSRAVSAPLQGGVSEVGTFSRAVQPAASVPLQGIVQAAAPIPQTPTIDQTQQQQQQIQFQPVITATGGGGGGGGSGGTANSSAQANNTLIFPTNFTPPELNLSNPNFSLPGFSQLPGFDAPNLLQTAGGQPFQLPQMQGPAAQMLGGGGGVGMQMMRPQVAPWNVQQNEGTPLSGGIQARAKAEPEGRKAAPVQPQVVNNMPPLPPMPFGSGIVSGDMAGLGSAGGAMPKDWNSTKSMEALSKKTAKAPKMNVPPPPDVQAPSLGGEGMPAYTPEQLRQMADMLEAQQKGKATPKPAPTMQPAPAAPEVGEMPPSPGQALEPMPAPVPAPTPQDLANATPIDIGKIEQKQLAAIEKHQKEADKQAQDIRNSERGKFADQMRAQAQDTYQQMQDVREELDKLSGPRMAHDAEEYAQQYVKQTRWTQIANAIAGAPVVSNAARYQYAKGAYMQGAMQQRKDLETQYRDLKTQYTGELTAANTAARDLTKEIDDVYNNQHAQAMEEIQTYNGQTRSGVQLVGLALQASQNMASNALKARGQDLQHSDNVMRNETTILGQDKQQQTALAGQQNQREIATMNDQTRQQGQKMQQETAFRAQDKQQATALAGQQNQRDIAKMHDDTTRRGQDKQQEIADKRIKLAQRAQEFNEGKAIFGVVGGAINSFAQGWARSDAEGKKAQTQKLIELGRQTQQQRAEEWKLKESERKEQQAELERMFKEKALSQRAYQLELQDRRDRWAREDRQRQMMDRELVGTVQALEKGAVYAPSALEKITKIIQDHPFLSTGVVGGTLVSGVKALRGAP